MQWSNILLIHKLNHIDQETMIDGMTNPILAKQC